MLVVLVGLMLLIRRDAARFAALAAVGFIVTGAWQPGVRVIETTRSFFGVHQRGRIAERHTPRCSITARRSTAQNGSARRWHVRHRAPGAADYYYYGRADFGRHRGRRAAQAARQRRRRRSRGREPRLSSARRTRAGRSSRSIRLSSASRAIQPVPFLVECAPDAPIVSAMPGLRSADRRALQSPRAGRVLVRRDPGASAHARGFAGYLSKLAPHGVIGAHLQPPHGARRRSPRSGCARPRGLRQGRPGRPTSLDTFKTNARVVVLARNVADLGALPSRAGWREMRRSGGAAWTDDYSDICWRRSGARSSELMRLGGARQGVLA